MKQGLLRLAKEHPHLQEKLEPLLKQARYLADASTITPVRMNQDTVCFEVFCYPTVVEINIIWIDHKTNSRELKKKVEGRDFESAFKKIPNFYFRGLSDKVRVKKNLNVQLKIQDVSRNVLKQEVYRAKNK
jgi:hypothetical protein